MLGNIVHSIFQLVLKTMDFTQNSIDKIVNQCIRAVLLNLYALDKKVDEVKDDCKRAVKNIQEWLAIVLNPAKN